MTLLGAVLSFGALAVNAALLVLVARHRPRTEAVWAFLLLLACFVTWDLTEGILRALPPPPTSGSVGLHWDLVLLEWSATAFIPATLLHFVLVHPVPHPLLRHPAAYALVYAPSVFILAAELTSETVIRGVYPGPLGHDAGFGPGYLAAAFLYGGLILAALLVLVSRYRRAPPGVERTRSRDLLLGFAVPILVGGTTDIFWGPVTGSPTRLGLGTLYTVVLAAFIAHSVLRARFLEIRPVREAPGIGPVPVGLARGRSHLVLERGRVARYAAFRDLATRAPGTCVTGLAPPRVRETYGLRRIPIFWVTSLESVDNAVTPAALNFELLWSLRRFMEEQDETVVLIDDLDLLVALAGFDEVARFLQALVGSEGRRSTVIVGGDAEGLPPDQLAVLRGMFDAAADLMATPLPAAALPADATVLVTGVRSRALPAAALHVAGARALIVSTAPPGTVREVFGERAAVLWLAEAEGAGASPRELDARAFQKVREHIDSSKGPPVVVLADLEQLLLHSRPLEVVAFTKDVIDLAATRRGRVVTTVDPGALDARTLALLKARFDRVLPTD